MREEFTRSGSVDFSRRYQGTFGYFCSGEKKVLVSVETVGENSVHFLDKHKNPYTANADQGNVFEFLPVEQGLYDCGDDLIHVCRRPARQWKRGICLENTNLYSFNNRQAVGVTFARLESIFGEKPKVANLYKQVMAGQRRGCALNTQFGIHDNAVYCYNRMVGSRTKDTLTVEGLWQQELRDIARDLGLDFKVEVSKNA